MGNTVVAAKNGKTFINQFSNCYVLEKIVSDPRLGEVELYKKINDPLEFVAVKIF